MALETAVMEDLLTKLLQETKSMGAAQQQLVTRLAGSSGMSPKSISDAQTRLKALGDSAEKASRNIDVLGTAGKITGAVLGDLASGVGRTAINLLDFAKNAMLGTASMADLFMSFKDLPIIGTVAGLFAQLVKVQESNLKMYRDLSKSGVNFASGLQDLKTTAIQLGLTQDQFVQIMQNNSDVFSLMGATANQGAKNFKNINLELTRSGGIGEQLRNLGFSFEEMNTLTASYVRVSGGLTRQQVQNTTEITKSIVEYGKELDLIARITGKSREEQEKALQKQMEEANWQAFLATKDKDTRDKLQSQVNQATQLLGEGGAQAVKARAMGIAVQGEAAQLLTSLAPMAVEALNKGTDAAMNKSITLEEFRSKNDKRMAEVSYEAAQAYRQLGTTMGALALQNDKMADGVGSLAKAFTAGENAQDKSLADTEARFAKEKAAADEQARVRSAELAAALDAEDTMRRFQAAMQKITEVLTDELLIPFQKQIILHMPEIIEGIQKFAKFLKEWLPKLFTEEGRDEIKTAVIEGLTGTLDKIGKEIGQYLTTKMLGPNVEYRPDLAGKTPDPRQMTADRNWAGLKGLWEYIFGGDAPKKERATGSFGVTGNLFEDFGKGTDVTLHGKESVVTPDQMSSIMQGSAAIALKDTINRLNIVNEQMLAHLKQIVDNTDETAQAAKALGNDAFA